MAYVQPAPTPLVLAGDPLEDVFQGAIAGITGIDGTLVRPRWQPEPANIPDFTENWIAFGITTMPADRFVFLKQIDASTVELECSEELSLLCSFYGPSAQNYASVFRDGLQIQQNRAALSAQKIKLVEIGDPRQVPALFKQVWTKRIDESARFRRWVVRRFTQNSIESLMAGLDNELYITPIVVNPPTP